MEFAKGRVVWTAARLLEEVDGAQAAGMYEYTLHPESAINAASYEAVHRDDVPVGLYYALASQVSDAADDSPLRWTAIGNVVLFLATTGDPEGAASWLAKLPETSAGARSTRQSLEEQLARLSAFPGAATRWRETVDPACQSCGFFAAMDAAVKRLAWAPEPARERRRVASFRAAILDRQIAVPLHMLEAFAPEK
jgi:hypothetical protein